MNQEFISNAQRALLEHLLNRVEEAEKAGQSPVPMSFGSLIDDPYFEDGTTVRDLVKFAMGKKTL